MVEIVKEACPNCADNNIRLIKTKYGWKRRCDACNKWFPVSKEETEKKEQETQKKDSREDSARYDTMLKSYVKDIIVALINCAELSTKKGEKETGAMELLKEIETIYDSLYTKFKAE